jgi:hypothetical protein
MKTSARLEGETCSILYVAALRINSSWKSASEEGALSKYITTSPSLMFTKHVFILCKSCMAIQVFRDPSWHITSPDTHSVTN